MSVSAAFGVATSDQFPKELKSTSFKNHIAINIVLAKGQWEKEEIFKRFEKARKIYQNCDVDLIINKFIEFDWKFPTKGLFYDLSDDFKDRYEDGAQQFLVDLNLSKKPLVIFFDSFDEYINKIATSFPRESTSKDSLVVNTAWITNKVNDANYKEKEPDSYSVLAHELGHILLNEGHNLGFEPNLMHYKIEMLSDKLTDKQCLKIKNGIKHI